MYGVILAGCCPREYRQQAAGVRVEAFDRFERTTPGLGAAAVLGPGDVGPGAAFSGRGPQRGRRCEPEGGVYLGVGEDPLEIRPGGTGAGSGAAVAVAFLVGESHELLGFGVVLGSGHWSSDRFVVCYRSDIACDGPAHWKGPGDAEARSAGDRAGGDGWCKLPGASGAGA